MSRIKGGTKCPCGKTLEGLVKKPTRFENTFLKLNCTCGSRFLLSMVRDKDTRERVFTSFVEILELSKRAEGEIQKSLGFKAKLAKASVKNALGLDPLPPESSELIKTEMDQVERP